MKIGQFEIHTFVEHRFRLDGGQMFGVVPKMLWSRMIQADDKNLIPMVNNLFVLKAHGKNMIFDIGLGDTLSEKECKIYGTEPESALDSGLKSIGLSPDDIDYLILTHLHTDHGGGAVKLEDNQFVPRFKNAKCIISQPEWQAAVNPDERTSAVYLPERYHALEEAGQVEFIDGSTELFPGIKAVHTGGHSEGHYGIEVESEGSRLFYYADIYPTRHHLRLPFVAATDVYPLESMDVKRSLEPRIVDSDIILAFDHDVDMPFARIKRDGKKMYAEPVAATAAETTTSG